MAHDNNSSLIDTSSERRPVLLLLDGHSLAFRAFYALPVESFSTTSGRHTNAVYGFLSMLSNLVTEEKPYHVVAAFDEGSATFRHRAYPDYKAQRSATPEEFIGQIELIRETLEVLGIPTISSAEYEADDLLATLATHAKKRGVESLICTGDRDSFQLIDDTTTVLYPSKGVSTLVRYTPEAVQERYGVTPAQYLDMAALRGDPSDNLPGVPKVGEKTAAKWINEYGSLAEILDHAEEIRGKVGENLREHLDDVRRNAYLTTMVRDIDVSDELLEASTAPVSTTSINQLFDRLEFGPQLRARVERAFISSQTAETSQSQATVDTEVTVAQGGEVAAWLAAHGYGQGRYGLVVSGSPNPAGGDVDYLALSTPKGQQLACTVVMLTPEDEKALGEWLEDSQVVKACHDAKATAHCLMGRGWVLRGVECDTAIASYIVQPGQRASSFADEVERHLGVTLERTPSGQLSLMDVGSEDKQLHDCARAAAYVVLLADELEQQVRAMDSWDLFHTIEMPLVTVLQKMEHTGIAVSESAVRILEEEFSHKAALLEAEAYAAIGDETVNLSSPKQLQTVLFEQLGMPKTKKTKTGYSTNAQALETLYASTGHPFLAALLGHRAVTKLRTTVTGLRTCIAPDQRIHTTFRQNITSTGRLSSTDPNLQNIPVRTEEGRRIREVFIAGEGYEGLFTADYSQIEMRVMAHLSQDEGLIAAFHGGEDLHSYVGSIAFDVPLDEVTPELRRRTKALSYGLAYGLSPYGLAQQLDIPVAEAKEFMDNYFDRFGGVRTYLHDVVEQARQLGYTETMYGRRRYLPELTSSNRVLRENAERAALNAPIQGTAADIIKIAMLSVDRACAAEGLQSRLLLQVHDELVVEVVQGERERVTEVVTRCMDEAASLKVPLEVSVGWGSCWDEAGH